MVLRVTLRVGVTVISIAVFGGTTLGAIAGFMGGAIDNLIMRTMDIILGVPIFLISYCACFCL